MFRLITGAILIALSFTGVTLCGCSEKLEDGYEPQKLNATGDQRQHYYSAPYASDAGKDHESGAPQMMPGH